MRSFQTLRKLLPLFTLSILLFTLGCSDDDDNPVGDDSEHSEAFGCALLAGTDTLAIANGTSVTGVLSVTVADTLCPIEVWFLDEHGDWFRPEAHEHTGPLDDAHAEETELRVTIGNSALASVRLGHEISEELEWAFFLDAIAAGATSLEVAILHEGHEDYVSPEFSLAVAP